MPESFSNPDEVADGPIRRRFSKASSPNFQLFRDRFGKHVDVRKKSEVNISKDRLSYDGSHSPNLSRRNTTSGPVPVMTQDFGFPGARTKPGVLCSGQSARTTTSPSTVDRKTSSNPILYLHILVKESQKS
ncbi:conserved hypothetical protein [Pyrenophora tritici-repentis Pt-1C-BFP]|uniref:Uncharacterized protein n=1 Tax=Pyrenophora tritici-repentis (strain Pt-1C-BFP) TaxID=426418 RepID=B2WBZ5_PYRTR|nr:uncharacterized protein PTRG_07158 [Pyrenophora tritici-repentis Pt-1C-BFP]EDU50077.1 conserved hypothetical protein [Pyrenophora tritici-repentis Pt-1C-BFP]